MKELPIRKIVVAGVLTAVAVILALTPAGFIPWVTGTSITILAVPVIIGAILEGPVVGLFIGFLFGLFSLIKAVVAPQGPGDIIFVNPLISVFPRLFIGPVAWLVYRAVKKPGEILALILAGITGSLTNTILVLAMIGILGLFPWVAIGTTAVLNGLPEAVASAIITLAVVSAWKGIEHGRKGSRL